MDRHLLRILVIVVIALQGGGMLRLAHDEASHNVAAVQSDALSDCDPSAGHPSHTPPAHRTPDVPAPPTPADECPVCHMLTFSATAPPPLSEAALTLPPCLVLRVEAAQAIPAPYFCDAAPPCGPPAVNAV